MNKRKLIIFLFLASILTSCAGVQDAFEGKKRSEKSDEFLVEKKNPLTIPPDINELPVPLDQEEEKSDSINVKKILEIDDTKNTTTISNEGQKGLEQTVLEQINN